MLDLYWRASIVSNNKDYVTFLLLGFFIIVISHIYDVMPSWQPLK